MRHIISKKVVCAVALVMLARPFMANAQEDLEGDSSREPAAQKAARVNDAAAPSKARYRLYPGGQDEQDIQVQPTLPQAQRYLDPSAAPQPRAPSLEE